MKIDAECDVPIIAPVSIHILKYLLDFITILGKPQGFDQTVKFLATGRIEMIISANRPYFAPYPGFFYKAHPSNYFVILDDAQFPRKAT